MIRDLMDRGWLDFEEQEQCWIIIALHKSRYALQSVLMTFEAEVEMSRNKLV
jgi:hypothetical protein